MKISAINNSPNFGTKVLLEDKRNNDVTFDQLSKDTQSEFLKAIKKLETNGKDDVVYFNITASKAGAYIMAKVETTSDPKLIGKKIQNTTRCSGINKEFFLDLYERALEKLAPDTNPEDKKPVRSVFDKYRV